jgi:hypothetical protein
MADATTMTNPELADATLNLTRAKKTRERAFAELEAHPDDPFLEAKVNLAKAEVNLAKAEVNLAKAEVVWLEAGKPKPSQEYDVFVAASESYAAAQKALTQAGDAAAAGSSCLFC